MNDIKIKEVQLEGGKLAIFNYVGSDDPVLHINNAIALYTSGYNGIWHDFVDANMNNPWVRIIITDINPIQENGVDFNDIIRDVRLRHLLDEK